MRKILSIFPMIMVVAACTENVSLENEGQQAGAAADKAIEQVDDRVDAERIALENSAAKVREEARGVEQDVKDGLKKVDNAVEAAAAELKK